MNSIEQEQWAFARAVADSDAVLRVYAAPEFDEMGDDGKEWIRALVVEARRTAQAELVELLGEAFDFLGGCDGAAELRGKLLATLSKYRTDATKGKANGG